MVAKIAVMTAMRPANGSPCCARCSSLVVVRAVHLELLAHPRLPRLNAATAGRPARRRQNGRRRHRRPSSCRVRLARRLAPARAIEAGKVRVAGEVALDLGQIQHVGARQRVAVERLAADHENRRRQPRPASAASSERRKFDVGMRRMAAARDDDVLPPGKRLADRLPGMSPHDDRVPGRQCAKPPQIVRQPPRQPVVDSDDAVARDGGNDRDSMRMGRIRRAWRAGRGWCIVHASLLGLGIV